MSVRFQDDMIAYNPLRVLRSLRREAELHFSYTCSEVVVERVRKRADFDLHEGKTFGCDSFETSFLVAELMGDIYLFWSDD